MTQSTPIRPWSQRNRARDVAWPGQEIKTDLQHMSSLRVGETCYTSGDEKNFDS
jgi:hypothetical protein